MFKKEYLLSVLLRGDMKLNQRDISAGESEACLDLSFHLCINLLSPSAFCDRRHPTFHAAAELHQFSVILFEDTI